MDKEHKVDSDRLRDHDDGQPGIPDWWRIKLEAAALRGTGDDPPAEPRPQPQDS